MLRLGQPDLLDIAFLSAAGDAGAVTASGKDEPLRRRAEVVYEAYPR